MARTFYFLVNAQINAMCFEAGLSRVEKKNRAKEPNFYSAKKIFKRRVKGVPHKPSTDIICKYK